MQKHFTRQLFTQAIYLHVMLNIAKHYLAKMATICQQFAYHAET